MENNIIALKKDIENIINKYKSQISYFLPKPHLDFVNSEKTNFVVKEFSCDHDVEVEWKYYYNTHNPAGYVLGHNTVILSLKNDIIPIIKKLISLPSKTKKQKRKDTLKNVANIALFFMGSELSWGDSLGELSDEEKKELSSAILGYEEMIKSTPKQKPILNENENTSEQELKSNMNEGIKILDLLLHTDKPLQYKNRPLVKDGNEIWYGNKNDPYIIVIDIFTLDSNGNPKTAIMQLIDSKNHTKIIRQKAIYKENEFKELLYIGVIWLENELEKYSKEKEKEKIRNSNNRGEQEVEYHIKWIIKTLNKYIVSIDNNCETKYRYNCILLKNPKFIDEAQEYDHILVTPSGVIIIETKDWQGTIDITPDGKWIRHKEEDGTSFGVASPITQMRRHEQLMKSILPDVPVHSILCFSNPSAIINGKEHINEYPVINIEQLETELNKICSRNKYSNEKIDEIVTIIDSHKINKMK